MLRILLLFCAVVSFASCQVIDQYTTPVADPTAGMTTATGQDGSFIMGAVTRDINNVGLTPADTCEISGGTFNVAAAATANAFDRCELEYTTIAPPFDLANGNTQCDCFNFVYAAPTMGAGSAFIGVNLENSIEAFVDGTTSQCLSQTASVGEYSAATSVTVSFLSNGNDAFSVQLAHVCCVPSVACRHTFTDTTFVATAPTSVTFTCEYFVPPVDPTTTVNFDISAFGGQISSVMGCTGDAPVVDAGFVPGASTVSIVNTPVNPAVDFSCTINFVATMDGNFTGNLFDIIYNAADGLATTSHDTPTSIVEDAAYCIPSTGTELFIQPLPPSTLPPTTEPPTTEPPTTEPPTTLAPTTEAPTVPAVPTDPPTELVCPDDDDDNDDDSDDDGSGGDDDNDDDDAPVGPVAPTVADDDDDDDDDSNQSNNTSNNTSNDSDDDDDDDDAPVAPVAPVAPTAGDDDDDDDDDSNQSNNTSNNTSNDSDDDDDDDDAPVAPVAPTYSQDDDDDDDDDDAPVGPVAPTYSQDDDDDDYKRSVSSVRKAKRARRHKKKLGKL